MICRVFEIKGNLRGEDRQVNGFADEPDGHVGCVNRFWMDERQVWRENIDRMGSESGK